MLLGYAGKLLRVNLSSGSVKVEDLDPSVARRFIGGRGLAACLLSQELPPGVDALGHENKLVLATGPFALSSLPGGTRYVVACKSPLSGGWGEANAGGRFGPLMQAAGFDAIIVEGCSPNPVYLWVHDGSAEIREASRAWGSYVADARASIIEETHPEAEVACIGPAGEALCKFASVISENHRAAARLGTGAVMGSKRLKGVAVHGTSKPKFKAPEQLKSLRQEMVSLIQQHPTCKNFHDHGTPMGIAPHNALGMYPAYNFREGVSDEIDKVSGPTMTATILRARRACKGCPIACQRITSIDEGAWRTDSRYGGPEFETIGALGTCCGIYDLAPIAKANQLCNSLGVDTINTGLSIAWAMECFERGILTTEDTGGLDLSWGRVASLLQLIEDIALRRGFGALLAEGLKVASAKVGQGSEAFAMQVKNQAFPTHDPRGKVAQAVSFATSNRGACHTEGMHDTTFEAGKIMPDIGLDEKFKGLSRLSKDLKAESQVIGQDLRAVQDSLIICRFTSWDYGPTPPAKLVEGLNALTGWDLSVVDLMTIGSRIFNLCRQFNVREGMSRADDTLPARMAENLPRGATSGSVITPEELQTMLDRYYEVRGWDRQGRPTRAKLEELGLPTWPQGEVGQAASSHQ